MKLTQILTSLVGRVCVGLLLFLMSAQLEAQEAFARGNALYKNEKYAEAAQAYQQLIDQGQASAELYFNLGNCHYKLHHIAPAIFYFEKAAQLNPTDREIQTNLDYARKRTIDDIKVVPKVGFHALIASYTSTLTPGQWGGWAIGLSFVAVALFCGYYISRRAWVKRSFFIGMSSLLLALLICLCGGYYEQNRLAAEHPAIIFAEQTTVKSEPRLQASDAFVLHEGTKVFVLETMADWCKIQLTDETTGWMQNDALKSLR